MAAITPSQTVGPFFGFALPFPEGTELVAAGAAGALRVEGQLLDGAGEPVPDGLVELWQGELFGRCRTDPEGVFHFTVRKPAPSPAPGGGAQAPHLNVTVFARGLLKHLVSRMYFPDEAAANAEDPVLRLVPEDRRPTLVARATEAGLHFDIRHPGEGETVFFELAGPGR